MAAATILSVLSAVVLVPVVLVAPIAVIAVALATSEVLVAKEVVLAAEILIGVEAERAAEVLIAAKVVRSAKAFAATKVDIAAKPGLKAAHKTAVVVLIVEWSSPRWSRDLARQRKHGQCGEHFPKHGRTPMHALVDYAIRMPPDQLVDSLQLCWCIE